MSAFAVFFLQSPSWLSCQRAIQDEKGGSNALTLFGIGNVPTDNDGHRRTWTARFAKGVPLSGEDGAPRVNWIERTVYHLFASWEDFEDFVMKAHQLGPHAPAAPPELTSKGLSRRYAKNQLCNGVKIRIAAGDRAW